MSRDSCFIDGESTRAIAIVILSSEKFKKKRKKVEKEKRRKLSRAIVTHVMYVISSRVYMYGCVLCNRVYIYMYVYIYTNVLHRTGKWNVHETAVITCDISIVLQQ